MSTFVSVGNATQPFSRLLNQVAKLAEEGLLPLPVFVQHGATSFCSQTCQAVPFISMDEFVEQVNNAKLLILHGGAGSIVHACLAGKVPIVMPRLSRYGEHIDDHQVEFVAALAQKGKVIAANDEQQLLNAIIEALNFEQHENYRPSTTPTLIIEIKNLLSTLSIELTDVKRK